MEFLTVLLALNIILGHLTAITYQSSPTPCPSGKSISKFTQHEIKSDRPKKKREFKFEHNCRRMAPQGCLVKCEWVSSGCRSTQFWKESGGERVYLAGYEIFNKQGKFAPVFFCCESLAMFVYNDCYWQTVQIDKPYNVKYRKSKIVGDMVAFEVYDYLNIQLEICSYRSPSGGCDKDNNKDEQSGKQGQSDNHQQQHTSDQQSLSKEAAQAKAAEAAELATALGVGIGVGVGVGVGVPIGIISATTTTSTTKETCECCVLPDDFSLRSSNNAAVTYDLPTATCTCTNAGVVPDGTAVDVTCSVPTGMLVVYDTDTKFASTDTVTFTCTGSQYYINGFPIGPTPYNCS